MTDLPPKEERLRLARETLTGLIADRYRVSISGEVGAEARLEEYDHRINFVKEEIASLEGKGKKSG